MKKLLILSIFTVIFSISAYADVRLPDNLKPSPTVTPKEDKKVKRMQMSIRVNPNVDEPTLRIPRSALKDLRAQLDELDGGSSNIAAVSSISGTQTLMSGLFFSAAMIFGGVWMFRGKTLGKNQKIVAGLLIFAFISASVVTVFANVAPPPLRGLNADLFSDKMQSYWSGASGTVKIEITDYTYRGSEFELTIPRREQSGKSEE
jgi:hypothetical protein